MSYARKGDESDVYVYGGAPSFVCCACPRAAASYDSHYADTPGEMVAHLIEDARAGHLVPEDAIIALLDDQLRIEGRHPEDRRAGR